MCRAMGRHVNFECGRSVLTENGKLPLRYSSASDIFGARTTLCVCSHPLWTPWARLWFLEHKACLLLKAVRLVSAMLKKNKLTSTGPFGFQSRGAPCATSL